MKKLCLILCCLLVLMSVLTACGTNGPNELKPENLGNPDGTPRDFIMLVRKSRYDYMYTEELRGTRVNDAVYNRNKKIEELYNIKFKIVECDHTSADFINTVKAGDGEYDLVVPDYNYGLDRQGLLANILELSEINVNDPHWYQDWNKNTTINGKLYCIVGDAALEVMQNLGVIFFNKRIAQNLNLDLYSIVNSGQWTVDKMLTICKQAAQNLNNEIDTDDVYGALYDLHSLRSQFFSSGLVLTQPSSNGFVEIVAKSDRNISICESLTNLIHDPAVRYDTNTARALANKNPSLFTNGKGLFFASALLLGNTIRERDPDFNYGIIVMPKHDENSDYISTTYGASVFGIPATAKNFHVSAVVLNAMNALSKDTVVYAFYDIVMKSQIADAQEDAKMIDLARETLHIDFEFINELDLLHAFRKAVTDKSPIVSQLDALISSAQDKLTKILEAYR